MMGVPSGWPISAEMTVYDRQPPAQVVLASLAIPALRFHPGKLPTASLSHLFSE